MKPYLKQAPTLLVIGVTGFAAYPTLFPEGDSSPPKATTKPSSTANRSPSVVGESARDPFQVARAAIAKAPPGPTSAAPGSSPQPPKPAALPRVSADDDKILHGMRLGGTFVDARAQIAIIDDKVYIRGESLRKPDGSTLPYVVDEVRKDSVLLRRGRKDFVLGFSNLPRTAKVKAEGTGLAKSGTPGKAQAKPAGEAPSKTETASLKKDASASDRLGSDKSDTGSMLLKLLSGMGTGSTGGGGGSGGGGTSTASNPLAGLGGSSELGLGSSKIDINPATISAGIDALMGKYDNLGRTGDTSGSTP